MKRIFLSSLFALLAIASFAQLTPVSADLGFSDAHLEDASGNVINANAISFNQIVKLKVNVHNFSETDAAPGGHFRIKIGLGAGFTLNQGFNLGTAALSSYFNWTYDLSGAQPQLIGNSIAPLPADFVATASFDVKAVTSTQSALSYNFLIANPIGTQTPLSDPSPSNNVAANSYTIAQQLSITQVTQNVSCYNSNDGSIVITATGGVPQPSYNFTILNTTTNVSVQNTTGVFTSLVPGTYSITVADTYGNSATATATITQPVEVAFVVNTTNVSCNGAADGTVTVSGVSSGAIVTIKKDGLGADLSSQSTFAPGTYEVTATAPNGNNNGNCIKTISVTITEPAPVTLSVSFTNVSCNGMADGTITASASVGAVIKINGNNYLPGSHYGPGVYTIVASVPDGKGTGLCTKTASVTITEPILVNLSITKTNVSCYGQADGTITASATGGATITINGMPYSSSAHYNAGTYTVVASAPGGNTGQVCTKTETVIVTEPVQVDFTLTHSNVTCNGANNGKILLTNQSAGSTITIKLNGTGANLYGQSNFAPGTYEVVATAPNGNGDGFCTKTASVTITQPTILASTLISKAGNVCHGGNDGRITVAASGGTPVYSYTIAGPTVNTTGSTSGIFTGLAAGSYTVTTTDANGCTSIVSNIIISQPTGAAPDITLSVADYTDNYFPSNASDVILIYQLTETGGNPALTDTLRITRQSNYTYSLVNAGSVNISGVTYNLDNSRWSVDNTNPSDPLYRIGINSGNQISCGQSVYIAVKITRATNNKSVFTLTSTVRSVTGETNLSNNSNTVVLVAQ